MSTERLDKIALKAMQKVYSNNDYVVYPKTYCLPEITNNKDLRVFIETINPCPFFSSNFIVVSKNASTKAPIKNVWIVFVNVTDKGGYVVLDDKTLRNMIDDAALYSNISYNNDIVNYTDTEIIVVARNESTKNYAVSKPLGLDTFVKLDYKAYSDRNYKYQSQDKRPIEEGQLANYFKQCMYNNPSSTGLYQIDTSNPDNPIYYYNWLLRDPSILSGRSVQENFDITYPPAYRIVSDEMDAILNSPKNPELDTKVGIYGIGNAARKVQPVMLANERLIEIYNHFKADGVKEEKAALDWLIKNYEDIPIFPNYSWRDSPHLKFIDKRMIANGDI
jgi:hypothetical protein